MNDLPLIPATAKFFIICFALLLGHAILRLLWGVSEYFRTRTQVLRGRAALYAKEIQELERMMKGR